VCAPQVRTATTRCARCVAATKLLEWLAIFSLFVGTEIYDAAKQPHDLGGYLGGAVDSAIELMPASWERRYYRQSPSHGLELHLVLRGIAPGWWAVVLPDGSLAEVEIGQRKTMRASPETGVMYHPQPVLTDDR